MSKVALVTRIIPHYRVPVYRELAKKCDLTVYYGRGTQKGASQNFKDISGFKARKLVTIGLEIPLRHKQYFLSFHPGLLKNIFRDKPDVVITEGVTNLLNNLLLVPFCKLKKIKLIWWDAGRDISKKKNSIRSVFEPFLIFLFKQADAFIVYGKNAKEYFISCGINPDKIFIAQNTIDTTQVEADIKKYDKELLSQERKRLGIEDKFVVLYSGAIERRKKIENLLLACKELSGETDLEMAVLIVGDGGYLEPIRHKIEEIGLSDIHLLGRKTDDVGLYFLLCDVVVLPGESTLAVNQAIAYGKPIITVAAGGPEYELVHPGYNGFVISPGDIETLKDKILEVDNQRRLQSMRERADVGFLSGCNVEAMAEKMVESILCEVRQ